MKESDWNEFHKWQRKKFKLDESLDETSGVDWKNIFADVEERPDLLGIQPDPELAEIARESAFETDEDFYDELPSSVKPYVDKNKAVADDDILNSIF